MNLLLVDDDVVSRMALLDLAQAQSAAKDITASEARQVIQAQSQAVTAGQVGTPPAVKGQDFQYTIDIEGRLSDPVQFGNIVVKTLGRLEWYLREAVPVFVLGTL